MKYFCLVYIKKEIFMIFQGLIIEFNSQDNNTIVKGTCVNKSKGEKLSKISSNIFLFVMPVYLRISPTSFFSSVFHPFFFFPYQPFAHLVKTTDIIFGAVLNSLTQTFI